MHKSFKMGYMLKYGPRFILKSSWSKIYMPQFGRQETGKEGTPSMTKITAIQ